MHRIDVRDDTGRLWYIFHNSDWSGEVMVSPADSTYDTEKNEWTGQVSLPGCVIRNACKRAFAEEAMRCIETALEEFVKKGEEA